MNTKEKIIEALEGKSKAEILAKEYVEMEKKLLKELSKLNNWGGEFCNCKDRTIIRTIFEGEFPEISTYCMKCGALLENE